MEHPCTEMVADVNLPAAQLQVRAGGVSPQGGFGGTEEGREGQMGIGVGIVGPETSGWNIPVLRWWLMSTFQQPSYRLEWVVCHLPGGFRGTGRGRMGVGWV